MDASDWPEDLDLWHTVFDFDEHFRRTPPHPIDDGLHDPEWQRQQQEADIVHRLLGLVCYAANSRNIELADLPDLADAISDLYNDSQQAAKSRH